MKIGCPEVPKPTYPSLLWPAEWKAPAPLKVFHFLHTPPQKLLKVCWWDQTLFLVLLVLWNGSIFWSESFCFLHRVAILRLCVENGINFEICILLISAHPLAIHLLASLREGTESKEIAQKEKKICSFSVTQKERKNILFQMKSSTEMQRLEGLTDASSRL